MKDYAISARENELEIAFYFDKNNWIAPIVLIVFILAAAFVLCRSNLEPIYDSWASLLLLVFLILYPTLEKYFKWKKRKCQKWSIREDDLFINGKMLYKVFNVKSVNVLYTNSQLFGGWSVYLNGHYNKGEYIIYERITRNDANDIAREMGKFLGTAVIEDHSVW
ncbi:MAG: hypothetical protein QM710_03310 [Flavobacterium sp.]